MCTLKHCLPEYPTFSIARDLNYVSAKSSASRGVAVLFSKNLEFKIHNSRSDNEDNYIIIDLSIDGLPRFTLAAIYAPNKGSPLFLATIGRKLRLRVIRMLSLVEIGTW